MSLEPASDGHESSLKTVPASLSAYDPREHSLWEPSSMLLLLLHGDDSIGDGPVSFDELESLLRVEATVASFASNPTGFAIMVRSLSSPSLSLFSPKLHSSPSDIVFRGRPRPSRGGAAYVVAGSRLILLVLCVLKIATRAGLIYYPCRMYRDVSIRLSSGESESCSTRRSSADQRYEILKVVVKERQLTMTSNDSNTCM